MIYRNIFKAANHHFKDVILHKLERQHFMKHLGIQLTCIEAGYVEAQLSVAINHKQQNDFVHGGVTATIADIAMGFAAFTLVEKGRGVVTSKLDITYLKPGGEGTLVAEGYVIKPGRILYYCECDIMSISTDGNRDLIARGSSTMCAIDLNDQE
jgi:uncharacterized protein (TIGR00369 family)